MAPMEFSDGSLEQGHKIRNNNAACIDKQEPCKMLLLRMVSIFFGCVIQEMVH